MGCLQSRSEDFDELHDVHQQSGAAAPRRASKPVRRGRGSSSEVDSSLRRRFSLETSSLPPPPRAGVRYPYEMTPEEKSNMQVLFGLFDVDNSGKLTAVEIRNGLQRMGRAPTMDACEAMVQQLDLARGRQSDGELDFKEFVRGILNKDSDLSKVLYPADTSSMVVRDRENF
eukprot:g7296.t1